jgi:hypothetical protein
MSKAAVVTYLMKRSTVFLRVCVRDPRVAALCLVPPVSTRASTAVNNDALHSRAGVDQSVY